MAHIAQVGVNARGEGGGAMCTPLSRYWMSLHYSLWIHTTIKNIYCQNDYTDNRYVYGD